VELKITEKTLLVTTYAVAVAAATAVVVVAEARRAWNLWTE
jgi:hypothetical protein